MLAFANSQQKMEWVRNHAIQSEMLIFDYYETEITLHVVDSEFNPELCPCWGQCDSPNVMFISDDVPSALRRRIASMEYHRRNLLRDKSHKDAVAMITIGKKESCADYRPLIQTLRRFYTALSGSYDERQSEEDIGSKTDIDEALELLS